MKVEEAKDFCKQWFKDKLNLAKENNLNVYKVTSKKDIEDIVRPLLKDKEINLKTD